MYWSVAPTFSQTYCGLYRFKAKNDQKHILVGGGGAGGQEPGSNGGGRSMGGGRRGGRRRDIEKGWEPGEMGKILQHWHNISQYEKYAEAGAAIKGDGNRECRVRELEVVC